MGMRRGIQPPHPMRFHAGADIVAGRGTVVYAPRAGVVERVTDGRLPAAGNPFGGYGNAVVLRHDSEGPLWSFYAHLDRALVTAGETVTAGTPIGLVGNSTNGKFRGMGCHLHFEVRHAREDGRSPYPGPYPQSPTQLRYNQDPEAWLRGHGVYFVDREWHFDPPLACAAPPLDQAPSPTLVAMRGAHLTSLRGGLAALNEASDIPGNENAAYEPVQPEPGFYRGAPLWLRATAGVALASVGVVGLAIALK